MVHNESEPIDDYVRLDRSNLPPETAGTPPDGNELRELAAQFDNTTEPPTPVIAPHGSRRQPV